MPKKSKKEKIIADQKRKLHIHMSLPTPEVAHSAIEQSTSFQFQLKNKSFASAPSTTYADKTELTAIKQDLTKTLVLAFVAVSVELALYWFGRGKI